MTKILTEEIIDTFLRDAVVVYRSTEVADPDRWLRANAVREAHAELSRWSIYTAAVCGDTDAVAYWLEEDLSLVSTCGGAHHWEPLMYAAYSRLAGASTMAVARLLLEHGANPNAYELVDDHYRFTVLTGVFGHGEAGIERQSAHPECEEFARLLLDAGADPNDSQAAYNRIFTPDNLCLSLLLEYGLNDSDRTNWTKDDGQPYPQSTLRYQLDYAIERGFHERVKLILDAGLNVNEAGQGISPWKQAVLAGRREVIELLEQHGAAVESLTIEEQLVNCVLTGDERGADSLLSNAPELAESVKRLHPDIAERACLLEGIKAYALVLKFGLEQGMHDGHTAAHKAAFDGRVDLLHVMYNAGYDLTQRDRRHRMPPVGWALYAGQTQAVEFLDRCDMDPFTAAARNNVARLREHINERPELLEMTFGEFLAHSGHADIDSVAQRSATLLDFALHTNSADTLDYLRSQPSG